MRKEIRFQGVLDTSQFDRAVDSIKQKLNAVQSQTQTAQKMSNSGMGGIMTPASQEAFTRATQQSRRELDQLIKSQAQGQEELGKAIARRTEMLAKLKSQQADVVKGSKEELDIKTKIAAVEARQAQYRTAYLTNNKNISTALDTRNNAGAGAPPPGGGSGGAPSGGGGQSLASILKGVSGMMSTLAAGVAIYSQYTGIPLSRNTSMGNTTQSLFGNQLQDIAGGNVVGTMAYMSERQRAAAMASRRMGQNYNTDVGMAATGIGGLASGIGGMLGMGSGRSYDMMMGGVSKGASAIAGNVLGMQGLSKALDGISDQYFSSHAAKLSEQFGKDYESMVAAEIQKNPLKNLATTYLQNNYQGNLGAQRMMGMGNEQFYGRGGFMETANNAGFTGDMGVQTAQQIQAAGGSTRGMQGATTAMRAARGFDLTNAGSVYGRISGTAGSTQASDKMFEKLLEESIKNGLDRSDFAEEQRKFADITSEILLKSGVSNADDAQQILQGFSKYVGSNPTTASLQGAQGAYQEQQGFSAEASGRGGALQFAGMMKNGLNGLSPTAMGALMEIPDQDVVSSNPMIVSQAVAAGMSPADLVQKLKKTKKDNFAVQVGMNPDKISAAGQYFNDNGINPLEATPEQLQAMPDDVRQTYTESMARMPLKTQYGGISKQNAAVTGLFGIKSAYSGNEEDTYAQKMGAAPGTRVEDEVVRSSGVAAQAMLENFRNFKTEITPASQALDQFTKQIVLFSNALNQLSDKDRAYAAPGLAKDLFGTVQSQAGKPKK